MLCGEHHGASPDLLAVALGTGPKLTSKIEFRWRRAGYAEIHWASILGSPYAGQVWAIEVELSPKPIERTTRIMTELLTPTRYAQVRDLPETAFTPEP